MTSVLRKTSLLVIVFLAAGLLYQGAVLAKDLLPGLRQILQTAGQPALWRSAYFSQGRKFANYVEFLNQHIPEQARVVLPPGEAGLRVLGNTPFMQFFLAPRQVINCTDPQCVEALSLKNTYLLVVNDFPGVEFTEDRGQRVMFNQEWGIFKPDEEALSHKPAEGLLSLGGVWQGLILPGLWLGLLVMTGTFFVQSLAPGYRLVTKIALGYGLGFMAFSITAGVASLCGVPLVRGTLMAITASILAVSSATFWLTRDRQRLTTKEERGTSGSDKLAARWSSRKRIFGILRLRQRTPPLRTPLGSKERGSGIWLFLILCLGFASLILSVGKAYHTTDEILLWGAKGYGIASTGSLANVTQWGTNTVAYPLHIPILIASFRILFGDALPASKIVFSGYYVCLMVFIYDFLVQSKIKPIVAGLSTLLIATMPLVFRHATIGYANLPFTYYLVIAVILFVGAFSSPEYSRLYGKALLSGLFFVAASWTRPEGWVISMLVICLFLGWVYIKRWASFNFKQVALLISPLLIYQVYWLWLRSVVYQQRIAKSDLPGRALGQILQGNLHLDAVLYILRTLLRGLILDIETWGIFGIALLIILSISLIAYIHKRESGLILWGGLLFLGIVVTTYYIASYDTVHDISWWINTGLDRMLLPALLLLWVGGIGRIKLFDNRQDSAASFDQE